MEDWAGKVILVVKAGDGLGRVLAESFAVLGAKIAAQDLTPINLDETISRIQATGGQARGHIADLASKLALQTMLNEITDEWGRIDILINSTGAEPREPLLQIDEWDWRRTVDLNLTGPFLLMQSVGRIMQAQGGGVIVNLVSLDQSRAAAFAGKSGLLGLTRATASEFGAYNIRVNAVSSGFPEAEKIPNLPDDPLGLVTFLCSEEAARFQGRVLQAKPFRG